MRKKAQLPKFLEAPFAFAVFVRSAIANPSRVGSICPSSPELARAMASYVPVDSKGLIVELGGGTGVVTEALLERGVAPERLVVIEMCPKLSALLKKRFPTVRVCQGDAAHIGQLIGDEAVEVSAVVSSLPLRSLPRKNVDAIITEVQRVLAPNGLFLQYTYNHGDQNGIIPEEFMSVASSVVWRNLPPARLDVFEYRAPEKAKAKRH